MNRSLWNFVGRWLTACVVGFSTTFTLSAQSSNIAPRDTELSTLERENVTITNLLPLKAAYLLWRHTADRRYFSFYQLKMDSMISAVRNDLQNAQLARHLLTLYGVTGDKKYQPVLEKFEKSAAVMPADSLTSGAFVVKYASLLQDSALVYHAGESYLKALQKTFSQIRGGERISPDMRASALDEGMDVTDDLYSSPLKDSVANFIGTAIEKFYDVQNKHSVFEEYVALRANNSGYLKANFFPATQTGLEAGEKLSNNVSSILFRVTREAGAEKNVGKGKTVLLDYFYNHEEKTQPGRKPLRFHYLWEEDDNNGFSLWGSVFKNFGAKLSSLSAAPKASDLIKASVYIIVDPDIPAENPHPNYLSEPAISTIAGWVKAGGVLVLMGNDKGNAEFFHLNQLALRFGFTLNEDSRNKVIGNQFEMGALHLTENQIFKKTKKIYMKEISTFSTSGQVETILQDKGDKLMLAVRYGKGVVFAVGDPWLYNEYTDGRKLPNDFQNFSASKELAEWLLKNAKTVD